MPQWPARTLLLSMLMISHVLPLSEALLTRPAALGLRPSLLQSYTALQMAVGKSSGRIINSEEDFAEAALSSSIPRPVMVFFTAPWCGPCRLSIPVVREVIKEYADNVNAVEICTDDFPDIAADAGVVSIPTIQIYYKGKVRETIVGCVARKVLSSAVEKVLEDVGGATNGEK
jgi:thioredoxin 1